MSRITALICLASALHTPMALCAEGTPAIVKWSLMVPPFANDSDKVDTKAPLSAWQMYRTFDTTEECLEVQQLEYRDMTGEPPGGKRKEPAPYALPMVFARCVASNDPGLHASPAVGAEKTLVIPQTVRAAVPLAAAGDAGASIDPHRGPIPIDTKITMSNWQNYRDFMPDGMIELFRGNYFWKMPADVEIDVGPTDVFPLPQGYLEATQKYASGTQMVTLPNGHNALKNYVAGMPFPDPGEPNKGWKILADLWYGPLPRIAAGTPETGLLSVYSQAPGDDHKLFQFSYVNRMLAHIYTLGYSQTEPDAAGAWLSEWWRVEWPEESKYTMGLTVFPQDDQQPEDSYVFIPAERKTLRQSTSGRCTPIYSTDFTPDDRWHFNGGVSWFQASWLRDQKVLALTQKNTADGVYPDNYAMPLGFAKPVWGQWEVRDAYVIDVRRVPSESAGYCYGKRIMYIDKAFLREVWTDLYDSDMRLWKVMQHAVAPKMVGGIQSSVVGSVWVGMWDLKNRHATIGASADGTSRDMVVDEQVPATYNNVAKYSTTSGLTLMQ